MNKRIRDRVTMPKYVGLLEFKRFEWNEDASIETNTHCTFLLNVERNTDFRHNF